MSGILPSVKSNIEMTIGNVEELHQIHLDPINYDEMTEDNATSLWLYSPPVIPHIATTIARHGYNHSAREDRQHWYERTTCYVGLPHHLSKESDLLTEKWENEFVKLPLGYISNLYYATNAAARASVR
jgi:hypothetical protein